ncbi:MAG TPA: uridine kinase [Actinotalea sp.]|nr:uridine kinase [Actinotalea sp.]
MTARGRVLDTIAAAVVARGAGRLLVGIDGADGVGKTVFADALALALGGRGRTVARIALDAFHQPRAVRQRRGPDSADGRYLDSFDLTAFHEAVVRPVRAARRPTGDLPTTIRPACFDHRVDEPVSPRPVRLRRDAVVVVDGLFLHRPELVDVWDLTVLLVAPVAVSVARMGTRDGTPRDPDDPWNWRYVEAQQLYRDRCEPASLATVVVDNADVDRPRILPSPGAGGHPDAPGTGRRAE